MNNTKLAQWFYYISIAILVATALGIVWRLIILPPDLKNLDVVGLTSSVLGVAATVLAILGAVAVAAWWTSLDKQVTKRINKLYNKQKTEINNSVDSLVKAQQEKIDQANASIQNLNQLAQSTEEIILEGLASLGGPFLEQAAQKAVNMGIFPKFPLVMLRSYTSTIQRDISRAERDIAKDNENLTEAMDQLISTEKPLDVRGRAAEEELAYIRANSVISSASSSFDNIYFYNPSGVINAWKRAEYWMKVAEDKNENIEDTELNNYKEIVEMHKQRLEQLKSALDEFKLEISRSQSHLARRDAELNKMKEQEKSEAS